MLALLFTLPALAWAMATSGVLRRRPAWWLAAPLAGALALAAAGVYVLSQNDIRRYVEQRYLVYAPSSYDPAEVDFGSRDRLFAAAWETFLDHPTLGSGLSPIGDFEQLDAHPHNLFLATARDGGLLGLLLGGVPFALLAARLKRPLAIEHRMAFVLGCFYLGAAQFSGSYYDCRFVWLYFLIAMAPAGSPGRAPYPPGRSSYPARHAPPPGPRPLPRPRRVSYQP
jgi:O-antigen ligase